MIGLPRVCFRVPSALALALLASAANARQTPAALDKPTRVLAEQKISTVEGGFGGTLPIFSQFGRAVSQIGDLDGNGTVDIAVDTPFAVQPHGGQPVKISLGRLPSEITLRAATFDGRTVRPAMVERSSLSRTADPYSDAGLSRLGTRR